MKPSKYKAKKTECDGIVFDSMVEMEYYKHLRLRQDLNEIKYFNIQVSYPLLDRFQASTGENIRAIKYKLDFVVMHLDGTVQAIDIKGMSTEVAKIKRKLFMNKYPKIQLSWISYVKKYGGWIDYFELQKIRRDNKKARQRTIKQKTI
jgi:hypothetical protein